MQRQVGDLQLDDDGLAWRGLLVRHLVLPNGLAGSELIFDFWQKKVSKMCTSTSWRSTTRPIKPGATLRYPAASARMSTGTRLTWQSKWV
jgi:hypothetical protein